MWHSHGSVLSLLVTVIVCFGFVLSVHFYCCLCLFFSPAVGSSVPFLSSAQGLICMYSFFCCWFWNCFLHTCSNRVWNSGQGIFGVDFKFYFNHFCCRCVCIALVLLISVLAFIPLPMPFVFVSVCDCLYCLGLVFLLFFYKRNDFANLHP